MKGWKTQPCEPWVMGLRGGRGFTLIEIVTTLVLFLILSGVLFTMLLAGNRIWQSSVTRSSNRQQLQLTLSKIESELKDSSADLITTNTSGSPKAFSFLSAYDANGNFVTDGQGLPVWKKYVIYYIPTGTTKLLRKEVYGNFKGPLSVAQLVSYCDGKGSYVSGKVSSISVTPNVADNSATLSITLQDTNQLGETDSQSQSITIFLRN